jgi:hypothetical protein
VTGEGILLSLDVAPEEMPSLSSGAPVTLIYPGGDAMLRLKGRIASMPDEGLLEIETVGAPTAGERREFIRAEAALPVFFDVMQAKTVEEAVREQERHHVGLDDGAWTERLVDISGNGTAFVWDQPVAKGDFLDLRFKLPSRRTNREVMTVGRVVRVKEAGGGFEVAAHFESIDEDAQNRLFGFVMTRYYAQIYKKLAGTPEGH